MKLILFTVLSNDKLYGSEEEFIEIIEKYATNICQELLIVLKALGDTKETKKQYNLALELFWRVIRKSELKTRPMMSLATNLWLLSQKLQDSNNKTSVSTYVIDGEIYVRLASARYFVRLVPG